MLQRAAPIACLLACLLAACGGEGGDDALDNAGLVQSSFKEVVAAALTSEGYEAEPELGFEVRAFQGPNWVDVDLEEAFARYEDEPEREAEIVAGLVEDAAARLEGGIGGEALADVRADVLPLLKARFELRTYGFEPAETRYPAGLAVVYAVDRVDDFTLVEPEDVERWGTSVEELHELAIANMERVTNEDEPLLCEPSGGQKLCGWASGDGYDATRMIVPALRRQIERELGGPAVYAAPMEHVFVALLRALVEGGETERLFRLKVERDFQTSDDPLSRELFVDRAGELVLLG